MSTSFNDSNSQDNRSRKPTFRAAYLHLLQQRMDESIGRALEAPASGVDEFADRPAGAVRRTTNDALCMGHQDWLHDCQCPAKHHRSTLASFPATRRRPERVPTECFVLASQLPSLPKGFLYACPSDASSETGRPVQVRIAFSIDHLHFVVVIPQFPAHRVVRTSGVHILIWPLDSELSCAMRIFRG
jgi:hypothetical protein